MGRHNIYHEVLEKNLGYILRLCPWRTDNGSFILTRTLSLTKEIKIPLWVSIHPQLWSSNLERFQVKYSTTENEYEMP